MKRFAFRLERLLQLRELAEQEQARVLAVAMREEEARRAELRESEAHLAAAREQYGMTPRELSQAGTLQNLELAISALIDQTNTIGRAHETSLERVEQERHEFDKARMARRVIERLREHRQESWSSEVSRFEQNQVDETAIQRIQARPGGG